MAALHGLLKRLTSQPAGLVIDIPPPTAEDVPFRLHSVPPTKFPFDPAGDSPEAAEFRRRLAHPEEFIHYGEFTAVIELD